MTETTFEPTYSLEADEPHRRHAWLSLRKLLVLMVLLAAIPLAVVELLSKSLGLKRSQIELIAGETSHQKRFLVRGITPDELARRVEMVEE